MANALASLGRSGIQNILPQFLGAVSAYKESEGRLALNEAELEKRKREKLIADKKAAEDAVMHDIETSSERLPGGPGGEFAKGFIKYAEGMGYIDYSLGGKGRISKADKDKVWAQLDENPTWAKKLSIDHYHNLQSQLNEINTQLGEKPDDKKLLETKEKISSEMHQVGNWIPGIEKQITRQHEEKKAAVKAEVDAEASRVTAQREVYAEDTKAKALLKHQQAQRATTLAAARIRAYQKGDKVPSSGEAVTKVASLTKAKATFGKTEKMDVVMAGLFPEMAKQKGGITKEQKAEVYAAYDEAIAYYKDFVPKDEKRQKAIEELKRQNKPITPANIDFIMGHIE